MKFQEINSPDLALLKEVTNYIPNFDQNICLIIESYLYEIEEEYFPNTNSLSCRALKDSYGKYCGFYEEYFKDGTLFQSRTNNREGKLHGEWIVYYKSGKQGSRAKGEGEVMIRKTYKNGALDGPYIDYYPNGKVWKIFNYVKGKKQGEAQHFEYIDGKTLIMKAIYNQNLLVKDGGWTELP